MIQPISCGQELVEKERGDGWIFMSASNNKGCFEVGRGPVRFVFDQVVVRSAGWLGRVGRVVFS